MAKIVTVLAVAALALVFLALFAEARLTPEVMDFLKRLTRDQDSIKSGEFSYWRMLKKSTETQEEFATDECASLPPCPRRHVTRPFSAVLCSPLLHMHQIVA